MALHLHLVTLCNNEGWDYANESLKYHANKLSEICQCALCWLLCLLKIYIFLHEACKHDFYLPKLQEKHNKAMLTKLSALEGGSGAASWPARTPAGMCKKCSGQVHSSGVNKCPFHNMSDADAKKQLGQLMTVAEKMTLEKLLELVNNMGE